MDVIVEVTARGAFHKIEETLTSQGFRHEMSEGAPICRWRLDGLLLDVMPTDPAILGFSNQWYPDAVHTSEEKALPSGQRIRLVAPPYFIATKLEAFFGRGGGDFFASHDLEDLGAVVDGRPELVGEVQAADPALRAYLKEKLAPMLADEQFCYALQGHLPGDPGSQARLPLLLERLRAMAAG